jgi:hypothetical protein
MQEAVKQFLISIVMLGIVAVADAFFWLSIGGYGGIMSDMQSFFYSCMNAIGMAGASAHAIKVAMNMTSTTIETNPLPEEK